MGKKQVLPERKINSIAEFLEKFPEVKEIIIDGTEGPVQRPKDAEKQTEHYSGKKKRHTRKRVHLKFAMSNYAYYDSTKSSHLDKQSAVSALEEDF